MDLLFRRLGDRLLDKRVAGSILGKSYLYMIGQNNYKTGRKYYQILQRGKVFPGSARKCCARCIPTIWWLEFNLSVWWTILTTKGLIHDWWRDILSLPTSLFSGFISYSYPSTLCNIHVLPFVDRAWFDWFNCLTEIIITSAISILLSTSAREKSCLSYY